MDEKEINAKGVIMHDNEVVANLKTVYFNLIDRAFTGQEGFEPETDKSHINKVLYGTIVDGTFTHEASELKHYGNQGTDTEWFKRNLTATEIMVLTTEDGKKITLKNIRFDSDTTKDNRLSFNENVKFRSHCLTIEDRDGR